MDHILSDLSTMTYPSWKLLHKQGQEGRLVQGKEQWLHFAGAAMKKYPTSKVRETQVRWVLREGRHTDTIITVN